MPKHFIFVALWLNLYNNNVQIYFSLHEHLPGCSGAVENLGLCRLGFLHRPRDLANVNARKTCLIPILDTYHCYKAR